MNQQNPEQNPASSPTPAAPPAPTAPPAATGQQSPPAGGKQPPWGAPENFDAEKAWELIQNLRTEKTDPALRTELETLRQQQQAQRDALAAAFGVAPEETSDAERLAQQVENLRSQIVASERRALAVEHKVPEAMLTATDAEGMRAQALALVEFAQAAHVAALSANPTQTPPPAFQQNPGQGQGNTPPSAEAIADAEYEKYYPSSK